MNSGRYDRDQRNERQWKKGNLYTSGHLVPTTTIVYAAGHNWKADSKSIDADVDIVNIFFYFYVQFYTYLSFPLHI